jgi:copper chaperone CopZ
MKTLFLLIMMLFSMTFSYAGFRYLKIGIDGLTCSACSRSVEMGLRKLSFITSVEMDLENTEGKIILKEGEIIRFEEICSAVKGAGFSIRYLKAELTESITTKEKCIEIDHTSFQLLSFDPSKFIQIIHPCLIPKKELKKYNLEDQKPACKQTDFNLYLIHVAEI